MSPGLRLVGAVGAPLVGALACFALPEEARVRARLVAAAAVAAAALLLATDAADVLPAGRVERSLGELVPGVVLLWRLDPAALVIGLLACAASGVALLDAPRRPLERAALLLCLGGSLVCALAGNAVLLFGGLELGNTGALLLQVAGSRGMGSRSRLVFGVQHAAALGLLAAAVQLQISDQTSDLTAVPAAAFGLGVAGPWVLAGAVRVLAPLGLPGRPAASSVAWASVAAAPSGVLVLLRLGQVAEQHPARQAAAALVAAGVTCAVVGAAWAATRHRSPAACGRALCLSVAGQLLAVVALGTPVAVAAAAAVALALVLGLAAAPAWLIPPSRRGRFGRGLIAMALATAGGLPLGYGTAALVLSAAAPLAGGLPGALLSVGLIAAAVIAAAAAALAVRAVLSTPPAPEDGPIHLDAAVACFASLLAAAAPGLVLGSFVDRVAGLAGPAVVSAVDSAATVGPGAGWSGGYLLASLTIVLAIVSSAAWLGGAWQPRPGRGPTAQDTAEPTEASTRTLWPQPIADAPHRVDAALGAVDRWLAGQPGLALVVAGAVACLFIFR